MVYNNKFIRFREKDKFEEEKANNNILDTSIVFIEDSHEIWTLGNYYDGRSSGGYLYIENFDRNNFLNALNLALASLEEGEAAIINCTYFSGVHTVTEGFVINNPVTLLFGGIDIEFDNSPGTNLFTFGCHNISILGINRNTDKTQTQDGATIFRMLNPDETLEGYHIKSKGNKNLAIKDVTLVGLRTKMGRLYNNTSYPIDGVGGIYLEKAKPEITEGGNTCNNIRLENILIAGSKAHGIYIDTPILSSIKNVRLSDCGGHGIFINGGTSIMLENVYSSSANMAGFCIYGSSYVSLNNCVSENGGIGFWLRSAFNVTLMNPGVEMTRTYGNNPWRHSQPITGRYGLGLITLSSNGTDTVNISDVNSDASGYFIGYGLLITGGRAINVFSPYIKSIAQPSVSEAYPGGPDPSQNAKYINVIDNARAIYILNPGFKEMDKSVIPQRIKHEIGIGEEVSNIELIYNTAITTLQGSLADPNYVTNADLRAPIYCKSKEAVLRNGKQLITLFTASDPILDTELANKQYVDNLLGLELSTKQDKGIKYHNIEANTWESDLSYSDFPYKCDIVCPEVTSSMYAEIIFNLQEATSGNYAPICETGEGIVTIWSSVNNPITIPTIIITK